MTNPRLTLEQLEIHFKPLLVATLNSINDTANEDPRLFWALRRKLAKELTYLERGTPAHRMRLKAQKWEEQEGICPICEEELPEKGAELDREEAYLGYTPENTRLIHHMCHTEDQASKNYA